MTETSVRPALYSPERRTALVLTGNATEGAGNPPVVVFEDNFETDKGWVRNAGGADTATTGVWERGDPEATSSSGPKQLGTATSGVNDLVTGRLAGGSAGANDIDGGATSIQSPAITLPAMPPPTTITSACSVFIRWDLHWRARR